MKTLIFAMLLAPSVVFAQAYEGYKGYQRYQGVQPSAPVVIVPKANQPAFNSYLKAETDKSYYESRAAREEVINQRLGDTYRDNPNARGLMGTIIETEKRARGY